MSLLFLDVGLHFFFSGILGKVTFFLSLPLCDYQIVIIEPGFISWLESTPKLERKGVGEKNNSLLDQSLAQRIKKNHNWNGKIENYSMFACTYISSIYAACMLSHLSHVWLFASLWTIALQAPLFMGFSRQKYWSGLPCPPPGSIHVICC